MAWTDRLELQRELDTVGADPKTYALWGEDADDAYVLEEQAAGWAVYYTERGLRRGEIRFATEDAACRHVLDEIKDDVTMKISSVRSTQTGRAMLMGQEVCESR